MPNYISKFVLNGVEYLLKAAASVTGVKGDNESSYRSGDVNITKDNIGLGNVGNYKAVSTVASQGLSDTEKSNARANIGAGTSSFSGNYNDLSNKPTIPTIPGVVSTSANGLAPKVTDTSKYLRGDGTWATPTNTTYSLKEYTATPTNLAAFVQGTANGSLTAHFRFKDTNNVFTLGAQWIRGYLQYQNGYGTAYDVDGKGFCTTQDQKTYLVTISGKSTFSVSKELVKDTTYSVATQSANGLMSSSDKKKLDTLSSVPTGQYHLTFGKST